MRICLVSDFFFPSFGGVETHLFQLAQCLIERGHSVFIVTHYYGNRIGIRYMTNFLKVYYLPIEPFYCSCILATIVGSLPYLRYIFRREKIDIVHGHSAFSALANEALWIASLLELGTVFTDHSLTGFADPSAIIANSFLRYSLVNTNLCICVSHTGKANTVLRSGVPPEKVYVIPNAVDAGMFQPDYDRKRPPNKIFVAVGSRLVHRKGVDLLALVIPEICKKKFGKVTVDFLIAGDGPKRILLEEMIENHGLQSRVTMLGSFTISEVRDKLLVKSDLFLNTSLTEAFCIAIVEATACGLTVVSTKVGGVPEVLPDEFIYYVEPDVSSIEDGLTTAIWDVINDKRPSKKKCHDFVKAAYNWQDIARRTEIVYDAVMSHNSQFTFERRVRNLWESGALAGPLMAVLFLFCHYWIMFLDIFFPVS